ncbi:hypothetical protein LBMAG42_40760 [Deltaproteobacteria bacterium]|nr:hypothetical protein LBMAG42_40760 [Deltaproteobacteria bacterium]
MLWLAGFASAAVLRHALVVGANVGGSGLEPLHYAEEDARRFSDVLTELGQFDPVYITVLYSPTAAQLKEALKAHADVSSGFDDDLFLFYYSGHADARGLRIGSDTYDWDAIRTDIRAMPAEVKVGVLDACRSGSITRLKGAALSQPFMVNDRLAAEGEAWITAASADEEAQESERLRGSFFTHYLISGMRGAADVNDGTVSLEEAYKYAFDRVVSHTGETAAGVQHPNRDFRIKGEGELALTQVSDGHAQATLPAELDGLVTVVRLPDRTPMAEVAKVAGTPVTLALAPGSYAMRKMVGQDLYQAEVMLTDGARVTVTQFLLVEPPGGARPAPEKGGAKAVVAGAEGVEAAADTPAETTAPAIMVAKPPAHGLVFQDAWEATRWVARENQGWWETAVNAKNLRQSPLVASGLSTLVPGAGQIYNKQGVKGGLLMTGTFLLFAGSVFVPDQGFFAGSITGPDPLSLGAAMLYGTAIADAAYFAGPKEHRETRHPSDGATLSTYAGWDPSIDFANPYVAGMSGDWLVTPNVSIGIDRLGWTRNSEVESRWNFGSRISFAIDGAKWRPSVFVAGGGRVIETVSGSAIDETFARMTPVRGVATARVVGVVGTGLALRYYVTPRYFLDSELRFEVEDATSKVLLGGGVGVHFGK